MSRRPEIGNVQLYPDRPLRESDRNGYVLKFYCPIRCQRIRRNCGTRDRREARRMQRDCRERLLNGEYLASGGAITEAQVVQAAVPAVPAVAVNPTGDGGPTWQECCERYVEHRRLRVREGSLVEIVSRLGIAERILEARQRELRRTAGLLMSEVATLECLEDLQRRLLRGDVCRYSTRSPNTVNTLMGAVMAFLRFCGSRGLIASVPELEKVDAEEVMKGRPVTEAEFQRMLDATPDVVGRDSAASWIFALKVLWESGFRVGEMMDFSWDDSRHIHPVWSKVSERLPTILIPATQKNGLVQEIPMLPGLQTLLGSVPERLRRGWVVELEGVEIPGTSRPGVFRPSPVDLKRLVGRYSNSAIGRACGVSETAVRKWLQQHDLPTCAAEAVGAEVPASEIRAMMGRAAVSPGASRTISRGRLTVEHVSRVIARIGRQANVVVQQANARTGRRKKFASAHDLRRGLAERLINAGVSAETLKVVMRHKDFGTTEKHYGAMRSAQSAGQEVLSRLSPTQQVSPQNSELVGGLVGGQKKAPQLSAEELLVLKSLLAKL